jgi:hypothetical protein
MIPGLSISMYKSSLIFLFLNHLQSTHLKYLHLLNLSKNQTSKKLTMFTSRITILFAFIAASVTLVAAAPHENRFKSYDDDEPPCQPGWQRCDGTGFETCVPGGEWVYQDCAPGTSCVQGWGGAQHHIWCIVPPAFARHGAY